MQLMTGDRGNVFKCCKSRILTQSSQGWCTIDIPAPAPGNCGWLVLVQEPRSRPGDGQNIPSSAGEKLIVFTGVHMRSGPRREDNRLKTGARPDDRRTPGPGIDLSVLFNTSPLLILILMLLNLAILQANIFLIYTMNQTTAP